MDCKLSSTSPLPWIWVLEILTSSNQVDTSLLLDLVKKTPQIYDDICGDAREAVFLRILERICIKNGCSNSVSCASSPKIGLDPSERCEDVLQRILPETSDLKAIGSKMLQWDIQPFITQKRSSLPKCSLQKLKAAILTGSHPSFSSLKEPSGLQGGNQAEDRAPLVDGDCNGNEPRLEGTNTNTRTCPENDQLISPALANASYLFSGNLAEENLLPAEKNISAPTEIAARKSYEDQIIREDGGKACIKAVQKHKPSVISSLQDLGAKLISFDVDIQTTDAFMTSLQYNSDETESLEDGTHVENTVLEGPQPNDGCTSSKGHSGTHEVLPYEKCSPRGDTEALIEEYNQEYGQDHNIEEQGQDHDMEDAERDKEGFHQCDTANGNMNKIDQVIQRPFPDGGDNEADITGDMGWFHNETSDIAAKKNAFLSSQCTFSQDFLVTDWTERNLCMTCNNGGKLLVCSSRSCPLVVHECCLVCDASFDTEGNFYCPFCAYSRAISQYLEIKKKVSLARKDLTTFISTGSRIETASQLHGSCRRKRNHLELDDGLPKSNEDFKQDDGLPKSNEDFSQGDGSPKSDEDFSQDGGLLKSNEDFTQDDGLPKSNEDSIQDDGLPRSNEDPEQGEDLLKSNELNNMNFIKKVSSCKRRKKMESKQAGPSVQGSGHSPPFGRNNVASSEAIPHTSKKDKKAGKRASQVSESVRVNGKGALPIHNSEGEKASCQVRETGDGDAEIRYKEGVLSPPETDRPQGYECSPSLKSAGAEEISEEETSRYYIRVRNPGKQFSYPVIPQLKRTRLPWTSAEEEKLKEGMQKICSPHDKTIPWKKIMEFGAGTFHNTRTTIDLKDKWRNICRAAAKS